MTDRFQPSRAGIIEVWDYTEQEFRFADGRLVLRGPNGSGKTKALEVLVPFVLDGSIDARRLDPFSGKDRTMRSNLLYQGDKSRRGYCWLEFRKGGAVITIGVGLQAQETRPQVRTWFFVTDRVVGDSLPLLGPDRVPMTRKEMRSLLGDEACFDSRDEHRRAVDRALYGFDGERYAAMLELVLTLRRPQLAKELDPDRLSEILSQGLRTVDPEMLRDSAQAFEDLEATRREIAELGRARAAVDELVTTWRTYLRTRAARRVAALQEQVRRVADTQRALEEWGAAVTEGDEDVARHTSERDAAMGRRAEAQSRRDALLAREAYQNRGQLTDARELVAVKQQAAEAARGRADEAVHDHRGDAQELASSERKARAAREEEDAARSTLLERCRLAEVAVPSPFDVTTVEASIVAQRVAVETTLEAAKALEAVEARLAGHEERLQEAIAKLEDAVRAKDLAAREADAAAADRATALEGWLDGLPASLLEPLDADALRAVVAEGDLDILGRVNRAWRSHKEALVEARKDAADRAKALEGEIAEVERTIAEIEAERDDAPPAPPTRGASRDARAGAPLWRLVRFRDEVSSAAQARLEGALLASGLLDAWVDPEPTAATWEDTHLVPGPAVQGASLADVLVPEGPAQARVAALLASVSLESGRVRVGEDGSFALGPLEGSHDPERPRYIGATARERHRRDRVEALRRDQAALTARLATAREESEGRAADLRTLEAARGAVPSAAALREALGALRRREEVIAQRAADRDRARARRDESAREQSAAALAFREVAQRNGLSADRGRLRALEGHVAAAREAHRVFGGSSRRAVEAAERWAAAGKREARSREAMQAAVAQAGAAEAEGREEAARYQALVETLGAEVREVEEKLAQVEQRIAAATQEVTAAEKEREEAVERRALARGRRDAASEQLPTQQADLAAAEARLDVFEETALAVALQVPDGDGSFAERLAGRVVGAASTDERLKATETQLNNRLQGLDDALGARFRHETRTEDGVTTVWLHDELGPADLATFQRRLAERLDQLSDLLQDRERVVFEDHVLTALVGRLRERIEGARALTASMDTAMRARRLASGKRVAIRWKPRPDADPARSELLELLAFDPTFQSPERLARMRGLLRSEVESERRDSPERTYREILQRALDYRAWFRFELWLIEPDDRQRRLSAKVHGQLSGGEKAATVHLPLFAAAHAHFGAARSDCPRLIALDEAFAGIDETGTPELLRLAHEFDLDWFLTGHNLWVTETFLPGVMHYDLAHDPVTRAVSAWPILWNGQETIEGAEPEPVHLDRA